MQDLLLFGEHRHYHSHLSIPLSHLLSVPPLCCRIHSSNPRPGKPRWINQRVESKADAVSPNSLARTQESHPCGVVKLFIGREAFNCRYRNKSEEGP